MFRTGVGLREQVLHGAHFINAKPISGHHPMNKFQMQDSNSHPAERVKLDETGFYLGMQYLKTRTRRAHSHSRASCEFPVEIGNSRDVRRRQGPHKN
jgi:hypothetical protein